MFSAHEHDCMLPIPLTKSEEENMKLVETEHILTLLSVHITFKIAFLIATWCVQWLQSKTSRHSTNY